MPIVASKEDHLAETTVNFLGPRTARRSALVDSRTVGRRGGGLLPNSTAPCVPCSKPVIPSNAQWQSRTSPIVVATIKGRTGVAEDNDLVTVSEKRVLI